MNVARDQVNKFLDSMKPEGGEAVEVNEDGQITLQTAVANVAFSIFVPNESEFIFLSTPVCDDSWHEEELIRAALALNLFQAATNGGVIALDDVNDSLVYQKRLASLAMDTETLACEVDDYLKRALEFREALACVTRAHVQDQQHISETFLKG